MDEGYPNSNYLCRLPSRGHPSRKLQDHGLPISRPSHVAGYHFQPTKRRMEHYVLCTLNGFKNSSISLVRFKPGPKCTLEDGAGRTCMKATQLIGLFYFAIQHLCQRAEHCIHIFFHYQSKLFVAFLRIESVVIRSVPRCINYLMTCAAILAINPSTYAAV